MSFCTLYGKEKYKDHFEAGIVFKGGTYSLKIIPGNLAHTLDS